MEKNLDKVIELTEEIREKMDEWSDSFLDGRFRPTKNFILCYGRLH